MYWDFAGPTVIADTSSLTTRRPWYSMVYNDAVQGLALSPYGMTDGSRYQVQHLAGQKQYELTNHLGNVQATISDLPVKVGEAHTEYHAPALPAVYDYYPFGMLMPDRYTSDTSSECVTVSQTKWVTTWVTHCYLAADWVWPAYSYYGSVSVSTSSGLQIAAGESSGIYFEMDVLPYEQQDVYLQTDAFYSGSGTLELQEYHGGQWHVLGSTTFDKIGEVRISIRPREDRIRAVLRGPFYVQVKQFCVQRPQLSQETVLVDICDTDGDKYRFGFNGQEKVNEWSGVGNHNTAAFWEYDTRVGRRYNIDPVVKPWESTYASLNNSPIWKTDVKGDDAKVSVNTANGIIDISTTVHVRGGTSDERDALVKNANSENEYMKSSGKFSGRTYKDENGKNWTINIDVKYVDAGDNFDAGNLPAGDNIFDLSKLHDKDKDGHYYRSVVYGGDKQFNGMYDYNTAGNFARIHGGKDNVSSGYTALHETMHLLGLVDRYDEKTQRVLDIKYVNDIMGGMGGRELHQNHIDNWGKAIIKTGDKEFILRHRVDQFGDQYEKIIMPEGNKQRGGTKPR